RFQPQQGKYKIFIIDEVHMLSSSAFNAFLKTLEEPPPYAIFILATTEKHKIIPTILSRCQVFDFKRIQIKDIVAHLQGICAKEEIEAEEEALHIIAQKADGALRDALSIFDRIVSFSGKKITYPDVISNLNVLDYDYYFRFTDALLASDLREVLLVFDEIIKNGFEADQFVNGLAEHLRNLLVCRDKETLRLLEVSAPLKKRYEQQAAVAPATFLLTALNIANECDVNYKMARNKRLHAEMALIKMCHIGKAVQLAEQGNQPVEKKMEKKTAEPTKPPANHPLNGASATTNATPAVPPLLPTNDEAPSSSPISPKEKNTPADPAGSPVEQQPADEKPFAPQQPPEAPEVKPEQTPLPTTGKTEELEKQNPNKTETPPALQHVFRKPKTSGIPVVPSLDSIDAQVEQDEEISSGKQSKLTQPDLDKAWQAYIEGTDKDSVKTMLKGATVTIEKEEVTVVVGSALAESTIRQERSLMEFLRESLHAPMLAMRIKLDPTRSNAAPAKPKKLNNSEKYWRMKTINPLVDEVRKRFDLKLDNE
ncbi:MAG TPA: DNA polymerase III subunit gamma/tau, partial [Bacteroidetes bacterium]|nr:DNA polymerase III subunit gamma/tau [Bacteroidota bacterium]